MITETYREKKDSLEERLVDTPLSKNESSKIGEWAKRYLPAEIIATGAAYLASQLTYSFTKDETYAAIAATHAGNIGYYGTVLVQDTLKEYRDNEGKTSLRKSIGLNATKMIGEFGPAFFVDTFLTRPAITEYMTKNIGNYIGRFPGVALGKIVSDVVFYSMVIPAYEILKKLSKKRAKS